MTDPAALLAAVFAAPADDLPRLVYADYLDDAGEPERAAFIRMSVGSGLDFYPEFPGEPPPFCEDFPDSLGWVGSRGFVASVQGALVDLLADLPVVVTLQPVVRAVASNREPRRCAGGFDWCCERDIFAAAAGAYEGVYGRPENSLPLSLWRSDWISFDSMGRPLRETRVFSSADAAHFTLSTVLLEKARRHPVSAATRRAASSSPSR